MDTRCRSFLCVSCSRVSWKVQWMPSVSANDDPVCLPMCIQRNGHHLICHGGQFWSFCESLDVHVNVSDWKYMYYIFMKVMTCVDCINSLSVLSSRPPAQVLRSVIYQKYIKWEVLSSIFVYICDLDTPRCQGAVVLGGNNCLGGGGGNCPGSSYPRGGNLRGQLS
jgi:hypothetical protein